MPLRDRIERIRTLPQPPNEESAKAQVILPILNELGWKSDDPSRVFFEYTVGGKRSTEEAHEAIGRNINDLRTEMRETMESMGKDLAKLTDMPDQLREVNRRLIDIDTNMGVR